MKSGVVFLVVGVLLAGVVLLAGGGKSRHSGKVDEAAVARLLEDRTRPWFQKHEVPTPRIMNTPYAPFEAMGAFADPPVKTPVMPVDLAYHLAMGKKTVPAGHPFQGRPAMLFDMRLKSRHLMESIQGGGHTMWRELPAALKDGALKDLARNTIVILYGEVYPHFEAPFHFRAAGFDAVYCLEGGLKLWKERDFPVESSSSIAEFYRQLESERPIGPAPQAQVEPENIGPVALKNALDLGLKPMIVFVGDAATYAAGHLPGAVRVPQAEVQQRFETEDRDRVIVVYCGCCEGITKGLSGIAVSILRQMGFKRLFHLEGHLKGWREQNLPLEMGSGEGPAAPRK
ncbi:MAG TPA: rhodanese-like domain-containing protein [Planctomycetota bacterium]|nr:rhodanese-like domain-containing protein [Planctomycetota bacterium]